MEHDNIAAPEPQSAVDSAEHSIRADAVKTYEDLLNRGNASGRVADIQSGVIEAMVWDKVRKQEAQRERDAKIVDLTAAQVIQGCTASLLDPRELSDYDRRDMQRYLDEYDRELEQAIVNFWRKLARDLPESRIVQLYRNMYSSNRDDIARYATMDSNTARLDKLAGVTEELTRKLEHFDAANRIILGDGATSNELEDRNRKLVELYGKLMM